MDMLIVSPPSALLGQVSALWALRGEPAEWYCGLPKPHVELIFSLSGAHQWRAQIDQPVHRFSTGWVTPLQAGARFARTAGSMHLVGARLTPAGARRLIGTLPPGDGAPPIPIDDALGGAALAFRDRLGEARHDRERLAILAAWLEGRLATAAVPRMPAARQLAALGWRSRALADLFELSERGLRHHFEARYGVSPKFWLRLSRFDALLRDPAWHGGELGLAALAHDYGFADQAHMSLEFKRFAGVSPAAFHRARLASPPPPQAPHFVAGLALPVSTRTSHAGPLSAT